MTSPRGSGVASAPPAFSLVDGGPLHGVIRRIRIGGRPIGPVGLGIARALFTWLLLLGLTAVERSALGPAPVATKLIFDL